MKTSVNVNFTKNNTNKKDETVFEFQVRGNLSDEQIVRLARLKSAGEVVIDIRTSQCDIDDYEEPREGVKVTVEKDGTAHVEDDGNQLTMEEAQQAAEDSDETSAEEDTTTEQADSDDSENDPMHNVKQDLPFSDSEKEPEDKEEVEQDEETDDLV